MLSDEVISGVCVICICPAYRAVFLFVPDTDVCDFTGQQKEAYLRCVWLRSYNHG